MSLYRRYRDGRTQRWSPDEGEWHACPPDEPQTRQRKPNEGMIVLPAEVTGQDSTVSIDDLIRLLSRE